MNKIYTTFLFGILIFTLLCIACNSDSSDSSSLNTRIAGKWKLSNGESLTSINAEDLEYIDFNEEGSGIVFYKNSQGILANDYFLYAVLNDNTLSMDFSSMGVESSFILYQYDRPDDTTLILYDNVQNSIYFSSAEEVPTDLFYSELTVDDEYRNLGVEPSGWTDLVWDGTYLWYEEYDTSILYPFDPVSGVIVTASALDFSSIAYSEIQSIQNGDFWAHCACGGSPDASRRNSSAVEIDNVDTETDLGNRISIRAIAWDGTYLYLNGRNRVTDDLQLLKVDSDSEPDSLEGVYESLYLSALTADGTYFWGITSYYNTVVIKFELTETTISVLNSYSVPDSTVYWTGIASVGQHLYLLGQDESKANPGVIVKTSP